MNNVVKGSLIFAIGMGIGSAIGWAVAKRKFNKIIEEMVPEPEEVKSEEHHEEPPIEENKEKAAAKAMKRYSSAEPPFAITPEEFDEGEDDEYERESLTYYEKDKVLMNPYGQGVTAQAAELVGEDFEDEFVGDICYIRNNRLMTDYEITREHCSSGLSGDDAEDSDD